MVLPFRRRMDWMVTRQSCGSNRQPPQAGTNFKEGTIELEMRGTNLPMQSFVGVAFRVVNATNYDAVYFRPFNFKAENPVNQGHSVQYHSMPDYA